MANIRVAQTEGATIKARRIALGLTQEYLALEAKITIPTLRRIEAGGKTVRTSSRDQYLAAISEAEETKEESA